MDGYRTTDNLASLCNFHVGSSRPAVFSFARRACKRASSEFVLLDSSLRAVTVFALISGVFVLEDSRVPPEVDVVLMLLLHSYEHVTPLVLPDVSSPLISPKIRRAQTILATISLADHDSRFSIICSLIFALSTHFGCHNTLPLTAAWAIRGLKRFVLRCPSPRLPVDVLAYISGVLLDSLVGCWRGNSAFPAHPALVRSPALVFSLSEPYCTYNLQLVVFAVDKPSPIPLSSIAGRPEHVPSGICRGPTYRHAAQRCNTDFFYCY
jgi:hypothetical protein